MCGRLCEKTKKIYWDIWKICKRRNKISLSASGMIAYIENSKNCHTHTHRKNSFSKASGTKPTQTKSIHIFYTDSEHE